MIEETKVAVVADTNLFLQCKTLAEIDWRLLFPKAHEVEIIVARVVIGELDRLKNDGNSRRAKKARTAVSQFGEMLRSDDAMTVKERKPRVVMRFAPRAKILDSDHPKLDLSLNDDRFVAEAIVLRTSGENLVVVTGDVGVELTCKELGVRAFPIPEQWRLPPEGDATEKELKRLQGEFRKQPSVTISFLDQLSNDIEQLETIDFELPPWESTIRKRLADAIVRQNPIKNVAYDDSLLAIPRIGIINRSDVEQYRSEYSDWRKRIETWTARVPELLSVRSRIFAFHVVIQNSGQAAGEQLRLDLQASSGVIFVHSDWAENKVSPEKPPKPPRPFDGFAGLNSSPFLERLDQLKQETRDPFALYFRDEPAEDGSAEVVSLTCDSLHPSRTAAAVIVGAIANDVAAGAISVSLSGRNTPNASATLPVRISKRAYKPSDRAFLSLLADHTVAALVSGS